MVKNPEPVLSPFTPQVRSGISRLSVISSMLGGVLIGAVACSTQNAVPPAIAATSDNDILNFALNLEYLEAEFYSMAVTGKTIEAQGQAVNGTGTAGGTTGGAKVNFTDATTGQVAAEIMKDELEHVAFLRAALGSAAIAKPAINLDGLGSLTTPTTDAMQATFLVLARAFEDTGVSAYGGAAPLITSKTILGYAAQILAVEAYHAGAIRLLVAQQNVPTSPPGALDNQDVLPPPTGTQYFTTYQTGGMAPATGSGSAQAGLAIVRDTTGVLNIVKPFFPSGLNGTIH
ncbi:MAG: ferritin-like domain-containing protein [Vulcanimicrobiaceae bacterium]